MITFSVFLFAGCICWPLAWLAALCYARYEATSDGLHLLGRWMLTFVMLTFASMSHLLAQPLTEYLR